MPSTACTQDSGAHAENLIRHKARQLVGTYGFTEADRDDLEQELRVDLLRRIGKYNPAKAKLSTFTARIVEHCIATIIEARKAAKRDYRECDCSLNDPVTFEDGDEGELGDTVACETYLRRLSPASGAHITRLLSNAMLLTEGYDEPSVDCVVMLRPTKVRSLYSQIIGRGTRLSPGKDHLLLLDFLWLSQEHSLISPAHLIAGSAEEADAITEALALGDGDLEEAKQKVDADRAASLRERLRENSKREARTFDALEFALSINEVDIAEFQPTMRWHEDEMTPKQRDMLLRYGIAPESVRNKGQACAILDKVFTRMDLGLASAKQVRWLRKLGHPQPELATFAEAKAFLDQRWNGRASGAAA